MLTFWELIATFLHRMDVALFYAVNHLDAGPLYQTFLETITRTAKYTLFTRYMVAIALFGACWLYYIRMTRPAELREHLERWLMMFFTLLLGFWISTLWVPQLKDFVHLGRPYMLLPQGTVRITDAMRSAENAWGSFPSGHMAFSMLMVAGLWPVLNRTAKLVGVVYLFIIGWSRLALGVHYPVDLIGGGTLAWLEVQLAVGILRFLYNRLLPLRATAR